jgi:hypothetical protein
LPLEHRQAVAHHLAADLSTLQETAMNPVTLAWQHDGKFDNGQAFGAAEYAGTELALNGLPFVSIPVAFAPDGLYSLPIASLGLADGGYAAVVRVVAANGNKSAPSNVATFTMDTKVPTAPFGLAAS